MHGKYNQFGLMAGSVWLELLGDLKREAKRATTGVAGWVGQAFDAITLFMKSRANAWASETFPFGSEMPWDSTGQEEVYLWCKWFGLDTAAAKTLNAVLAYTPRIPSWAYHGNARRYFDFLVYGGETGLLPFGTEREFHHYGAPLNALVVGLRAQSCAWTQNYIVLYF